MKLVRRNLLAIIPASLLSLFGTDALAAAGPKLKPKKLGQKIVFQGYTYICVKSKGKLIWKKGAKVVSSSPKPSSTTSDNPPASPKPTPSQSASVGDLTFVAKSSDIAEGEIKILDVKPANEPTFPVSVTRVNGLVIVVSAICTHEGCQIRGSGGALACPCHGSGFNAVTGAVTRGPAERALRKYVASEDAGSVFIKA
ncbi:MAG: Rieske (2Fe-2S) protein [Candidatus Planktophila sp.]|nr:Rieske (2Fe-2S) protein [Candidatus Planktophila sp.]